MRPDVTPPPGNGSGNRTRGWPTLSGLHPRERELRVGARRFCQRRRGSRGARSCQAPDAPEAPGSASVGSSRPRPLTRTPPRPERAEPTFRVQCSHFIWSGAGRSGCAA